MIGSVYSGSASITVSGGTNSTYVNGFSGAQGVGNMRYNTTVQKTEVFDGNQWIPMNLGTVSIGLSQEVESILDWARKKRNEELELAQLAKTSPAIKDLMEQVKQKQDQIEMVKTLIKKETVSEGVAQAYQPKPSMIP